MKTLSGYLYGIVLSLWVGGMSIFTFLVTPAIFRSYPRDTAGDIVGNLFPVYFPFTMAISLVALIFFLLSYKDRDRAGFKVTITFVIIAIVMTVYVNFSLYPETRRVKQEVQSFEKAPDDPARIKFRRLHAQSAVINLAMIADGLALLVMHLRKRT